MQSWIGQWVQDWPVSSLPPSVSISELLWWQRCPKQCFQRERQTPVHYWQDKDCVASMQLSLTLERMIACQDEDFYLSKHRLRIAEGWGDGLVDGSPRCRNTRTGLQTPEHRESWSISEHCVPVRAWEAATGGCRGVWGPFELAWPSQWKTIQSVAKVKARTIIQGLSFCLHHTMTCTHLFHIHEYM